jgi:hypothetical protein
MTTNATPCGRPGCGGTIEGGYCDTCGLAPDPAAGTGEARGGAAPAPGHPSARQAPDQGRRIELVDQANYVRPGTWT